MTFLEQIKVFVRDLPDGSEIVACAESAGLVDEEIRKSGRERVTVRSHPWVPAGQVFAYQPVWRLESRPGRFDEWHGVIEMVDMHDFTHRIAR